MTKIFQIVAKICELLLFLLQFHCDLYIINESGYPLFFVAFCIAFTIE